VVPVRHSSGGATAGACPEEQGLSDEGNSVLSFFAGNIQVGWLEEWLRMKKYRLVK